LRCATQNHSMATPRTPALATAANLFKVLSTCCYDEWINTVRTGLPCACPRLSHWPVNCRYPFLRGEQSAGHSDDWFSSGTN
jgi:hypothetical protein